MIKKCHHNWLSQNSSNLIPSHKILSVFSSLTSSVTDKYVKIWFGPGIINKTFYLKDIESTHVTKTPWYYGWGIRGIKGGLLFNVSGFYSVELQMKNVKIYRIGTDEPEKLKEAIDHALSNINLRSK